MKLCARLSDIYELPRPRPYIFSHDVEPRRIWGLPAAIQFQLNRRSCALSFTASFDRNNDQRLGHNGARNPTWTLSKCRLNKPESYRCRDYSCRFILGAGVMFVVPRQRSLQARNSPDTQKKVQPLLPITRKSLYARLFFRGKKFLFNPSWFHNLFNGARELLFYPMRESSFFSLGGEK